MVAYALARSSGVVSDTPRVKEPHASARVAIAASLLARKVMPSRWAMATACAGPVRCSSQTKYVLTERPYPVHMVRCPSIQDGLALAGHQYPSQLSGPVAGHRVTSRDGASKSVSSGRPADSAASMVNSLKVEPAG